MEIAFLDEQSSERWKILPVVEFFKPTFNIIPRIARADRIYQQLNFSRIPFTIEIRDTIRSYEQPTNQLEDEEEGCEGGREDGCSIQLD